jgi:hypothetical protein
LILHVPGRGPLTEEESNLLFMALLEDDTEDAPWMVMGSLQWAAASDFFQSLRDYAVRHRLPWFVAGMTPILYTWPGLPGKQQLAPDVFVAFRPDGPRSSFDLEIEGDFPAFVLEVVSPSSSARDQGKKRQAYELLGVREYALFTPNADFPSTVEGYRRNATGVFEPWPRDDQGRLWSEVLGLHLVARGPTLRAVTREGQLLPTLTEAVEAQEQATAARQQEAVARHEVEAENERLRREIEQLRGEAKSG